eukprot:5135286-Karenia_brevis.AAC.1
MEWGWTLKMYWDGLRNLSGWTSKMYWDGLKDMYWDGHCHSGPVWPETAFMALEEVGICGPD